MKKSSRARTGRRRPSGARVRRAGKHASPFRVLLAFGTRPEAIKMAPVVIALHAAPGIETRVIVTAQHREMLDQVLSLYGIVPDHDLDIMGRRQSLAQITRRALVSMGRLLEAEKPDLVLVQGDTTTTFAVALASYYARVPLGHVEAGLRSGDRFQPYPEEMNRILTSHLADWHYAPTRRAREALLGEGIPASRVLVTGNTVIDALLAVAEKPLARSPVRGWHPDPSRRLILLTAHRRESFGEPLREICQAVLDLVDRYPDVDVIYPVHLNPAVREIVRPMLGGRKRVHLVPPQGYHPFVALMAQATLILTDSGGIQEEAPSLGKPVLVLRHLTERPEAVEAGTVKLVGPVRRRIVAEARRLLDDPRAYKRMARRTNPYGDGKAAGRIVKHILKLAQRRSPA